MSEVSEYGPSDFSSTAPPTFPVARDSPPTKSPHVGLIGPTNVGKTVYFAVLDRALRDRDWKVEVYDEDSKTIDRGSLINEIRRKLNSGATAQNHDGQV